MKDEIDVSVRRSPRYAAFMAVGAIIGVLGAGLLTLVVDPAQMPAEYTVAQGAGLLLAFLGVGGLFAGGLIALALDWRGRKAAREYRVEAEIDIVDDPKAVAARRVAQAAGDTPAGTGSETAARETGTTGDQDGTTGDQDGTPRPTTGE